MSKKNGMSLVISKTAVCKDVPALSMSLMFE